MTLGTRSLNKDRWNAVRVLSVQYKRLLVPRNALFVHLEVPSIALDKLCALHVFQERISPQKVATRVLHVSGGRRNRSHRPRAALPVVQDSPQMLLVQLSAMLVNRAPSHPRKARLSVAHVIEGKNNPELQPTTVTNARLDTPPTRQPLPAALRVIQGTSLIDQAALFALPVAREHSRLRPPPLCVTSVKQGATTTRREAYHRARVVSVLLDGTATNRG